MRVSDISPEEQARRIRAAIGYSGKEIQEVAEHLAVRPSTFRKYIAHVNPKGVPDIGVLYEIAKFCGAPGEFMEDGFARFDGVQGALDGRLRSLEAALPLRTAEVDQLRADVDDLSDGLAAVRQALAVLAGEVRDLTAQLADDEHAAREQTQTPDESEDEPREEPGQAA